MSHTTLRVRGHAMTGTLVLIAVLMLLLLPVLLRLSIALTTGTIRTSATLVDIFGIDSPDMPSESTAWNLPS